MKNCFTLLFFALFFFGCSPKTIPIVKEFKTDKNHDRTATISSRKMNVIYSGVVNPFKIHVPGIPLDSIKVSVDQGKIRRYGKSDDFEIVPGETGPLNILVKWEDGGKADSTSFFYRAKKLPDPVPYLSGSFSKPAPLDSIAVDSFRTLYSIETRLKEFDFEAKCKVFGTEIVRFQPNGTRNAFQKKDARFSKKGKEFLRTAERGDIFIFRKIICRCPGDEKDIYRDLLNFSVEIF